MQDYPFRNISGDDDAIAVEIARIADGTDEMGRAARKWLNEHDRCIYCGSKLQVARGKEYHPEVDAYEPYCEKYCPICELGG